MTDTRVSRLSDRIVIESNMYKAKIDVTNERLCVELPKASSRQIEK